MTPPEQAPADPNRAIEVRDDPSASRYEVFLDGQLAGFATYRLTREHITFLHTEIDPAFEGHGLGGELARRALEDVRARGLPVVPMCPFIAGFIRRHPDEYLELVAPAMRARVLSGERAG